MSTIAHTVYFTQPYQVAVKTCALPLLLPHQMLVTTVASGISAGTEMLFYRGQVPSGMTVDASITGMTEGVRYPLTYGYACAGTVTAIGDDVAPEWLGRAVFAFHPHTSHFVTTSQDVLPIPTGISHEQAIFLPNMETAVNFIMDAQPVIGERAVILGQGIVGLMTLALLSKYPLLEIIAVDGYANRRRLAELWGATSVCSPDEFTSTIYDPDLILEVSSSPAALNAAIRAAGFGTRIIIGSWYGDKPVTLPLGGPFHRNRVRLISSQVSSLDGSFTNRWDKARRLAVAWEMLRAVPTAELISHRFSINEAAAAYALLDQDAAAALQVVFTYHTI